MWTLNNSATTAYAFLCHLILQRLLSESKFGFRCLLFSGLSPAGVELCVRKLTIVLPLRMIQEQTGALPLLLPMESPNYSCQLFRIVFDRQIYLHINFIALVDLVKQVSYLDTNKTLLWWCIILFYYVTHVLSWPANLSMPTIIQVLG